MTRQDMLKQLEAAVIVLQRREEFINASTNIKNAYRKPRKTRPIGFLGILTLLVAGFFTVVDFLLWRTDEAVLVDKAELVPWQNFAVTWVVLLALIITINMIRNGKAKKENVKIAQNNQHLKQLEAELAAAKPELLAQLQKTLGTWYPQDYYDSDAALFFYDVIATGKADSLKEAMQLYDAAIARARQEEYQRQILENQRKQQILATMQYLKQDQELQQLKRTNAMLEKQLKMYRH